MAEENRRAIDIDLLSHFKAKQDLQNLEKFKLKSDGSDLVGAVRYDTAQVLTEQQKAQARANIGAAAPSEGGGSGGSVEGAVRYDVEQALSDEDKTRARENIGTTDGTWENMPDKPFGEVGFGCDWNGNTADLESISAVEGIVLYEVASHNLTKEEIKSKILGAEYLFHFEASDYVVTIDETMISEGTNGSVLVLWNSQIPVVLVTAEAGTETIMGMELEFSSAGIWFLRMSDTEYVKYLHKDYSVKKIDAKYLPDDIKVELPESLVTTDENGLIPAALLPSYVDDVIEGVMMQTSVNDNTWGFFVNEQPIIPEGGKIYIDIDTGNTYRWSGSQYVQLNPPEITFATDADIDALFT